MPQPEPHPSHPGTDEVVPSATTVEVMVASGAPVIQGDMVAGDKFGGDKVYGDKITHIHEAPKPEPKPKTKPHNLPFSSIGPLFKGRAALMERLESASRPVAIISQGGVGKTRLAIEHAWKQVGRCNAVLLISAGSAEALNRNPGGPLQRQRPGSS